MRKLYLLCLVAVATLSAIFIFSNNRQHVTPELAVSSIGKGGDEDEMEGIKEDEEHEEYDGPDERARFEFEQTKDPALGYVPFDRLIPALEYTERLKRQNTAKVDALLWTERGPIYDSVGPSNGNTRAGNGYTAGRIRAVLVDTLNDPTGNTVICGGIAGGVWRCTNFLSAVPNWVAASDFFNSLSIASICQDPSNPQIMYFSTGEGTDNADAVLGAGVWKSTNAGVSWTRLPSTITFIRSFRIVCDNAGNVYLGARPTATPVSQTAGLLRSKDGGTTWTNITPSNLTSNASCTDLEYSSTGKLHASFGYRGTLVNHRFTTDPANVTSTTGWVSSTGIRTSPGAPAAIRLEMACVADTLYAATSNAAYNVDSCYKSVDGGLTWTLQNAAAFTTGLGSGQGWYSMTVAMNPKNTSQMMMGGLDAYMSNNSGSTITRQTFWVTTAPYVHADHHFMQWWQSGTESRILIGCDGGLFLSRDGGVTWVDKNRNLAIKQFYACAIHPDAGSDYLLGGAQDNGSHQLKNPGLSYSMEVTGGDGCFVYINQQNPQIQYTSYVYNQYRRSTNGGQSWTSVNLSTSAGLFVNPFDYDDGQNIMYASNGVNAIRRWPNANTATASTVITVNEMGGGNSSAFKVSPYTANRVFVGSSNGRLVRIDNANAVTSADVSANITDIRGSAFSNGNIGCINTGTSDQVMVVCFTNYGVNNVFVTTDGGANWSAVDGNLPDMPVRWAAFKPGDNTVLFLATEAGIYSTDNINGAATIWTPDAGFPTVRTTMLKIRASDNVMVASTHGRGMFTAPIPTTTAPEIRFITSSTAVTEESAVTVGCRSYKDYNVNVGIINPPTGDATVTYSVQAGNTAVQGVDFDFTTNGNFTTPSTQHVFTSGQIATKTITVRIYDDGEIESPESVTLGFTISGTTNAVAGNAKTHTISISDNDKAPITPGTLTGSIGLNNTALTQPFRGQFSDSRTQILYLASELKALGFSAGNITSLAFNVTSKNSTVPYQGFNIKMKNTNTTTLNGGNFETGATTVFAPINYSTVLGVNTFNLTTPFAWDGVSNVLLDICYDNPTTTGTATDNVAGTGGLALCHFDRVDNTAGCALTAATFIFSGGARPDITFTINVTGTQIATALNSSGTQYLTNNNDLYYYSATGELIARVRSLSAANYGCTQVVIDRAGTGTSQFWNTNTANYLMNKTFRVIPTTNNATGRYELTLYYTAAEKAGWETATGKSWNDIQLIKLPSRISNVTPTSAQPDGPGTVQVVTPTRGTFGAAYTLTYTFDNGFSGFGAGIPGRIPTILTLTGVPNSNTIKLDWTTSAETNSTKFELDKSYDRVNFRTIATVNAAGNKLTPSAYTYLDADMAQINYYRVRMYHSDGLLITSDTIMVKNDYVLQYMYVLTNPFDNNIRVRFARAPTGKVVFTLHDAAGKLIRQSSQGGGSVYYAVSGENAISHGIYVLDALVDGKHYTVRLMKK